MSSPMALSLRALIVERIRNHGPLTTAEFMDLALYHPTLGYYTRAPRRTGRTAKGSEHVAEEILRKL